MASPRPVFSIVPLVGLGPLRFGMSQAQTRSVLTDLGIGVEIADDTDFFGSDNALKVHYKDGTLSFIEVAVSEFFDCTVVGVDPFDTSAPELFEILRARFGAPEQTYDEYQHCFRSGIVTLYDADPQYDRKRSETRPMWQLLGIGDDRYLAEIDARTR